MSKLPVFKDEGSGIPLVLLHGLGNNHKSWGFVLEHLDYTKWRVITLDLLGFGDAPKPNIKYTPEAHSAAVVKTLDDLGVKRAVFAGHSMGCVIAIDIAKRYPKRAIQLTLFGAPLYKKPAEGGWKSKLLNTEGRYFTLFEVVKNHPDAVQAGGKIADELVPFVKGMEITEKTWPAYKSSLEYTIMQSQSYADAKHLTVPTTFVDGILDLFIVKKNNHSIKKGNRKHVRIKNVLGPHELTPRQGKVAAEVINKLK